MSAQAKAKAGTTGIHRPTVERIVAALREGNWYSDAAEYVLDEFGPSGTETLAERLQSWIRDNQPDWCWTFYPYEGPEGGIYVQAGPFRAWGNTSNQAVNAMADQLADLGWPDDREAVA